jgi:hypothetical protein
LDLTGSFHAWAAPSETVRAVTAQPDLVRAAVFRPSSATVTRRRLGALAGSERALVKELSAGQAAPGDAAIDRLPPARAAAVLEAAQSYAAYRRAIGRTDVPDPVALAHDLVVARSRLDVASQAPEVPVPPVRPEQGHDTTRVSAGIGRWDGRDFEELAARGAYQGILDADGGYVPGAQIEFLDLGLRRYGDSAPRVEYLVPLSILSLSPRDAFFRPLSWNIDTGWRRVQLADGRVPLVFGLGGGAGGTWSSGGGTARFYALLDADTRIDRNFSGDWQFGAGPRIGALIDPDPRWRIHAYARGLRYFLGQLESPWTLGLQQRIALARDLALQADVGREEEFRRTFTNASVSMMYYF